MEALSLLFKTSSMDHIQNSKKTFKRLQKAMPIQLIRKLSFRKKDSIDKSSYSRKSSANKEKIQEGQALPTDVLFRIIDHCDPVEQIRLRALSRPAKEYVDNKMKEVKQLDVRKTDLDEASTSDWTVLNRAQVALRIVKTQAEIIVDSKWTNRDILSVVGMMSIFRESIQEARIDAPLAELLVVSLSALDLNRWYAFQCYMKALDVFDADIHLECDFSSSGQVYWPKVQELTIRTTEKQAPHLARVLDYGVQCNRVLSRQTLDRLRIEFTDIDTSSKTIRRYLHSFRCWIGTPGFDHRFEQKFKPLII